LVLTVIEFSAGLTAVTNPVSAWTTCWARSVVQAMLAKANKIRHSHNILLINILSMLRHAQQLECRSVGSFQRAGPKHVELPNARGSHDHLRLDLGKNGGFLYVWDATAPSTPTSVHSTPPHRRFLPSADGRGFAHRANAPPRPHPGTVTRTHQPVDAATSTVLVWGGQGIVWFSVFEEPYGRGGREETKTNEKNYCNQNSYSERNHVAPLVLAVLCSAVDAG